MNEKLEIVLPDAERELKAIAALSQVMEWYEKWSIDLDRPIDQETQRRIARWFYDKYGGSNE